MSCVAIGGKISGHLIVRRPGFVNEPDGHPVIEEWIWIVVQLAREGPIERERNLVPLFQLSRKFDLSTAVSPL